ncbi:MAG TPA: uroporphyrinogen-III C-methyltransferase [Thermoanaerobaculia bacterium]|nr:uroporphyrinogen-III C-methyltransferase [Thermoanaerobaculia bacterium]
MSGKVFLVGAGPGDAALLTLRAAELLSRAEVVVIDALVSPEILAMIPSKAEIIDAGKRASAHTLPQDRTNALLVEKGREGKQVVRLKGGDPFIFGRGGEEAEELRRNGIPFEVVPGISSAIAGPAYAGIPVTHRSHATSVTLITGHESDDSTGIPWSSLAGAKGTIVFLMGMANLPMIASRLMEEGMAREMPVAVISRATTPHQQTVTGTLESIASAVKKADLPTPALIVVGEVVSVRENVSWFENRPLFGRTIVVTRAREQASELKKLLEEAGGRVLQFPTIEIVPPASFDSLDSIIEDLASYDWLIFTSVNGVQSFFHRLHSKDLDARALSSSRIAAVGQTTAALLLDRGIRADLVPDKFQSIALLPLLPQDQSGVRTAVIRAAVGRNEVIDELRARGGTVDLGIAYETRATTAIRDELVALLEAGSIDCVTFTSASTVDHFFENLSEEQSRRLTEKAALASIGPTTSEAIRSRGARVDVEADEASVPALAGAVIRLLER